MACGVPVTAGEDQWFLCSRHSWEERHASKMQQKFLDGSQNYFYLFDLYFELILFFVCFLLLICQNLQTGFIYLKSLPGWIWQYLRCTPQRLMDATPSSATLRMELMPVKILAIQSMEAFNGAEHVVFRLLVIGCGDLLMQEVQEHDSFMS